MTSLLIEATQHRDLDQVKKVLLQKDNNPNFRDGSGWTALHWASWNGIDTIVALLLESGADINLTTNNGFTPLHLASGFGYETVGLVLLQHKIGGGFCVIDAQDWRGQTALHRACQNGHEDFITLLLNHANIGIINCLDNSCNTPISIARKKGERGLESVRMITKARLNALK